MENKIDFTFTEESEFISSSNRTYDFFHALYRQAGNIFGMYDIPMPGYISAMVFIYVV